MARHPACVRLKFLCTRIAYPDRRTEKLRLEALEADVLLILEHLTGQHPEVTDFGGCSDMPEVV